MEIVVICGSIFILLQRITVSIIELLTFNFDFFDNKIYS